MRLPLPLLSLLLSSCVFPSAEEDASESEIADPPPPSSVSSGGGTISATGGASPTPSPNTGGEVSSASGGAAEPPPVGTGGNVAPPATGPCEYASSSMREVSSSAALEAALTSATPGTMIRVTPGTYVGDFEATVSGTAQAPIVLCSEGDAILSSDSDSQDTLNLTGDHWIISGITISGGLRGIVLDRANFNQLIGLTVHSTGQEAIHLRTHSSDNIVSGCRIWNTGTKTADFGEGIYIGSAKSNWSKYTGSSNTPDRSDRNQILSNVIGPDVRAEHIDIKEGTQGGLVQGNTFDGTGISGQHYADSWVDIKGNDYLVDGNTGENAPEDGFQTHVVDDEWGHDITFTNNTVVLNGPGYGFKISSDSNGIIVGCDNEVSAAAEGFSNRDCALIP